MTKRFALLVTIMLMTLLTTTAIAAEPADLIKYRKSVMKAVGGHMGAIAAIVTGKVESDQLQNQAIALHATSKGVAGIFPPESAKGDTGAKAAVWENPDDFAKAVSNFEQAAAGFLPAAESGDKAKIGAAFKTLGGTCKGCHDDYRQKKK